MNTTAMTTRCRGFTFRSTFLLVALVVGLLAGCTHDHSSHPHDDDPKATNASTKVTSHKAIVAKHRAGAQEAELLKFVNDPTRSFNLSDADVLDLTDAEVPSAIVDAALKRTSEFKAKQPHDHSSHEH